MPRIIRSLALTGAAAVAVLGTATTATADTPEQATAIVDEAVNHAAGAPVSLPDGRTLHVRGLEAASYRADAAHTTAVADLAVGTPQNGTASQLQPGTGYAPQQYQQQAASGGAIAVGIVLMLVLGIVLFFGIKSNKVSKGWAVLSGAFGITLGSTFVGPMVLTIGGSALGALGQVLGGL
ncbi:hypothetical protein ABZX98_19270 [Streptomyces sp. NPDC002992]|uniref:hypothetical protein n=1 Tax=Streptomyces sp. NPDC002992 TaxID=3154273 RepID=UPI0033BCAFC8